MLSRLAALKASSSSSSGPSSSSILRRIASAGAACCRRRRPLAGPGHRPEGVDRADLAGLVDEQQVEVSSPGSRYCATEIGLIMNTGLIAWTAVAGLLEELPDRLVPPFLGDLLQDDAHLAAEPRAGSRRDGP